MKKFLLSVWQRTSAKLYVYGGAVVAAAFTVGMSSIDGKFNPIMLYAYVGFGLFILLMSWIFRNVE